MSWEKTIKDFNKSKEIIIKHIKNKKELDGKKNLILIKSNKRNNVYSIIKFFCL